MNKDTKAVIKATFEANPNDSIFYANEAGHCFRNASEGLTVVKREDFEGELTDDEESVLTEGSAEAEAPVENEGKPSGKGKKK
jgi:hypothetical protein